MIHIAFNIDSKYVKHCAVTMVSLFENNRDERFTIHVIASDLNDEEKKLLVDLAASYQNLVSFYLPKYEMLAGLSIRKFSKRISMATYYRCILSEIIPDSIDRILYLDCDIVVLGNIRPLWDTPLDDAGVAAVEDIGANETSRYEVLHYPMSDSYFNAGVLLVNLKYWREHAIGKACIQYFHDYPERIQFNDQDLLNCVLHSHKVLVGLKWNAQDAFYRTPKMEFREWKEKYAKTLKNPIILHYTNRKPWDYDSQHPLRGEYFKYLDMTPWKGQRILSNPYYKCKRWLRLLPFYLGVRRAKYVRIEAL